MECDLSKKHCVPCQGGIPLLGAEELDKLAVELGGGWEVVNQHHLEKEFAFRNFKEALEFTIQLGAIAESEGHHPDIFLSWGKVRVTIYTHKVDGLTESDFILAARYEGCHQSQAIPEAKPK